MAGTLERKKFLSNGQAAHVKAWEARLAEPFTEGVTTQELLDRPGFNLAKTLWEENRAKFKLVARDLYDLYPVTEIVRYHKISAETVRSIRNLYPELVQAGKLKLLANLEEASLVLSERLINEFAQLELAKVPAALAVVIEKLALLSGGATVRTEHIDTGTRKAVVSPEKLKEMFAQLQSEPEKENG